MAVSDKVLISTSQHGVVSVLLNRPQALNSLDTDMVSRLRELLEDWALPEPCHPSSPPAAVCAIIKGAGNKAFCAGGDIKLIAQACGSGDTKPGNHFFAIEYDVNHKISQLRIPYVALIDGIVMGGGAGVSMHGHFRVATERTVFAMPECAIGIFPDIGSSFFLQQLPGRLGLWLGLTGARLKGVDVRDSGLATHFIPSHLLERVEEGIMALSEQNSTATNNSRQALRSLDLSEVDAVLRRLQSEGGAMPAGKLKQQLPWINHHFGLSSINSIIESLKKRHTQLTQQQQGGNALAGTADEAAWIEETLQGLERGSPLSLCVTFELFKRMQHSTLQECLQQDFKLIRKFVGGKGDFVEGVTALLIDRGRKAVWKYNSVYEVPPHVLDSFFEDDVAAIPSQVSHQGSRL
ncbi:hypothetical protein CEUSTIGMA_g7807.t1 [Chlamydomonas eustigma]|uniref:3-hydroxyisobutyryl-CoA hydrolase n=1 Tax=Chlamydomonas eustigma TaxID=1157962 RepID=A0A250XBB5_9CHLO|nr:hypothetical protein CEUSTIGMA_g7807.t1 [Chlamydomonas eustigma]|eukprot:GAX80368.1 hypothetical protein CEUSTIGMA_g7807.t1 [Chlamydomonas eustigma]